MTGGEFELAMQRHFESRGAVVHTTPASGDMGADLLVHLRRRLPPIMVVTAVQCKCYARDATVGVDAVREVYAGGHYYGARRALVVTTTPFTTAAIRLAAKLGVELWDRERLAAELEAAAGTRAKGGQPRA